MDDPIPTEYFPKSNDYQKEIKELTDKLSESRLENYECYKYRAFLNFLIGDYKSAYRDFSDALHFGM